MKIVYILVVEWDIMPCPITGTLRHIVLGDRT